MKIFTSVLLDWKGNIIESESFEYFGPIAKCDRSLTNDAEQAQKTAVQTAGNYQAAGQGIQQSLVPRLEQQAVNPTGFGAFGLGEMETGAEQTAAGASGAAAEQARLRANRTGNAASLGSVQAAGAGEAAKAGGSALQSILSRNAQLKATQQQQANQGLEGVLGEDIKGNLGAEGLVPEDIKAASEAEQFGWLQDVGQGIKDFKTLTSSGGGGGGGG